MATTSDRFHVEVKRPVILSLFVLLVSAGAWSQNKLPTADTAQNLRSTGFGPAQKQRQELRNTQSSLPDAPSAVLAKQRERFQAGAEARSPLIFGDAAINSSMTRESPEHLAPEGTPSFRAGATAFQPVVQKEPSFFDKYIYPFPSPGKQDLRYPPSTGDSLLGRASYAASRFLITRDDSGKRRFNASYLLRVLASSAAAASTTYRPVVTNIYRPYRTHTVSATFGNFGSALGGDAGRNIFHEFWPHVRQILGGHSPQVLQRVEKRIAGNPMPATLVSSPARQQYAREPQAEPRSI
jgi:hypothetical protein